MVAVANATSSMPARRAAKADEARASFQFRL